MAKSVLVGSDGIPCPRCNKPTEVYEHKAITDKLRRQPFYYSRWFYCRNSSCQTKVIVREEFVVWNNNESAQQLLRRRAVQNQLRVPK